MQCVCSPFASEAETQRSGIGPAPPDPSRELATFNPMTRLAKADKIDASGNTLRYRSRTVTSAEGLTPNRRVTSGP